jgi:hypothetical protein
LLRGQSLVGIQAVSHSVGSPDLAMQGNYVAHKRTTLSQERNWGFVQNNPNKAPIFNILTPYYLRDRYLGTL